MLRGSPFALANDRESGAINNDMHGLVGRRMAKSVTEILAATRERGVIRNLEAEFHDPEEGSKEALRLPERKIENQTQGERGLDHYLGVPSLSTSFP